MCKSWQAQEELSAENRIVIGPCQIVPGEDVTSSIHQNKHTFSSGFKYTQLEWVTVEIGPFETILVLTYVTYTIDGFIAGLEYGKSIIPAFQVGTICMSEFQKHADFNWPKKEYQGTRKPLLEDNGLMETDPETGNDVYGHTWEYISQHYNTKGWDGWLAAHTYL